MCGNEIWVVTMGDLGYGEGTAKGEKMKVKTGKKGMRYVKILLCNERKKGKERRD